MRVDCSRPFICDTLTPLYHAPVYAELTAGERLTYNQLNGMYWNELIAAFELELALAVLRAAAKRDDVPLQVREALRGFARDEVRHAEIFAALNRASDPRRYANGERVFLRVPPGGRAIVRLLASTPAVAALVWFMLLVEERSIAVTAIAARANIDDAYADVYARHSDDERRHVAIDLELLQAIHDRRGAATRALTAAIFRGAVKRFLVGPGPAALRIVEALIAEHPRLAPLRRRIARELRALARDRRYHEMLYSRDKVPATFARFDRLPEMRTMSSVLLGYEASS